MNPFQARRAKHLYACKIKETANGSWRRACGEARETLEVIAQRTVQANGEIDESETTARICENQTQKITDEKTQALTAHSS
jgi:hypothetical protein